MTFSSLFTLFTLLSVPFNNAAVDDDSLALRISSNITNVINVDDAVSIKLNNRSTEPIRIWNPRTRQGYNAVTLRLVDIETGDTFDVKKRESANGASLSTAGHDGERDREVITIEPNENFMFELYLEGIMGSLKTWEGMPGPNTGKKYSLTIQYEIVPDTDDAKMWSGKTATKNQTVVIASKRLQTPHDMLSSDYPNLAIQMMTNDPKWIGRLDDLQRTPLHIAARYAQTEAIDWLLKNGADVDAIAYNGFTPLHVASDVDVVELLLTAEPDLNLANRIHGHTPLQAASEELCYARSPDEKEKWKRIVKLYLKHDAEYDILTAIRSDDIERVKVILTESPGYADIFQRQSPLRMAASIGHFEICKYLLENFDVDVDDFKRGTGYPIIKEAVAYPDVVQLLIDHGANLKKRITWRGGRSGIWIIGDDATCLHYAAHDGVPETIKILIDAGVDIFAVARSEFRGRKNQTALEVAAFFGKTDNAIAILEHPKFAVAENEVKNAVLLRSLAFAANFSWLAFNSQDRTELMEAILSKSDDLDLQKNGFEIINVAVQSIHPNDTKQNDEVKNAIAVLRKHGAKLDVYSAVAIRDIEELKKLLATDPQLANSCSTGGYPAFHKAISMNFPDIVNILLDSGADIELPNKSESTGSIGQTPLACVAFWGHPDIAKHLIDAGANVNATDEHQFTPLHSATRLGNLQIARLLLENGANASAKDDTGRTPLDWSGNNEPFRQLISEFEGDKRIKE